MHVHFVVHEYFEAPGAYEIWARDRGYTVTYTRLYLSEQLPKSIDEIDLLIVMGGPQSPATTKTECPHFDAAAEKELILKCINGKKAVVGICLGAQLVGEALGAPYDKSPETEIGKFPITLTPEGVANKKFAHFGSSLDVGHWHNDMPGLTPGATIISSSPGCPRQIVEYNDLTYAFQCHMEFNLEVIKALVVESKDELELLVTRKFVQQPDVLYANDYSDMNAKLVTFLDSLVEEYKKEKP